jgi:hypothetical protein
MGNYWKTHPARLSLAVVGLLLIALLLAPAALAAGPIAWSPADSTYGAGTAFVATPGVPGVGATQPGPNMAYGAGFWTDWNGVYVMGFANAVPSGSGMPSLEQTDLAATALPAGTPLTLVFTKAAGQHVNSIAILGDPDAAVSVTPADPDALTAATQFTVQASVIDPVASRSGDAGAAFGLMVDCSDVAARDFQGSLFVTNMHWMDIDAPDFSGSGLAGLKAHGAVGSLITFDGIFTPAFLASMGIADPNDVHGYVGMIPVAGWSGSTFTVLGVGDGSLWPAGSWKYRIANANWCTHDILFGSLAMPAKAIAVYPKGAVGTARPLFKWKKLAAAGSYTVRVYRGGKVIMKKTTTSRAWRPGKSLPKHVTLTWRVRGSNATGRGAISSALKFHVK